MFKIDVFDDYAPKTAETFEEALDTWKPGVYVCRNKANTAWLVYLNAHKVDLLGRIEEVG